MDFEERLWLNQRTLLPPTQVFYFATLPGTDSTLNLYSLVVLVLGSVQTIFLVPKIVGFSKIKGYETHNFGKFGSL